MVFIKRVLFVVFGIACLLLGLTSTIVALALILVGGDNLRTPIDTFTFTLVKFAYCELFVAFGMTAILVGLRYIFNRNDWFASVVNRYWRKAVKYAMLLPAVVIGFGILLRLLDLLAQS